MTKYRFYIVVFWVFLLWVLMLSRGAYLQLWPNPKLEAIQNRQFDKIVKLSPRRGDILDREGRELATSILAYSLYADPKILKNPQKTARRLSRELKISRKQLYKKLKNKKSRFVWLKRRLPETSYKRIKKWRVRGLGFKEEYRRVYPNKTLASNILGFVGREAQGLAGLEAKYEERLSGQSHKVRLQRDARGRTLVEDGHFFTKIPEGADLFLTLDKDLQYWVENELSSAVKKHKAEGGWALVLDPSDSAILAMASFGGKSRKDKARNKVIQNVYEAASVMKTFAVAGAMASGLVEPNTKINTEMGVLKIGKRTITEASKKHRYKELTVSGVLAHSSNVGTAKIAFDMGDQSLYKTLRNFGFGEKSGVDLMGEEKGLLSRPPWRKHLLANISFGHGIAVTALQVANAYAAIANGGTLHQPYLVKKIYDYEKGEIKEVKGRPVRQVLPAKVAQDLKIMLSTVTGQGGTGYQARIDGYPVAGKTGTAQKVNPKKRGYLRGQYLANFVGFVPANDPQFVIYVAIDNPQSKKGYYASTVAAPLFRSIARYALRKQGTMPAYLEDGEVIYAKARGQATERKSQTLKLDEVPLVNTNKLVMPNLKGMTLREVLREFRGYDVDLQLKGHGKVVSFSPQVGRSLKKKSKVKVRLQ